MVVIQRLRKSKLGMKKISISVFVLTLSVSVFAQQNDTIVMTACNSNTPGWGESLGTISFYTDSEWTIEGNGITQIWSDAVTAIACQKETFNGGYRDICGHLGIHNFSADCRSNPGFSGDLFSWCAVVRFADILCPYPWRVPTRADFRNLDIALGGNGLPRTDLDFVQSNYFVRWNTALGGSCGASGVLVRQGFSGRYWAQTEINSLRGFGLILVSTGFINPIVCEHKYNGFSLRCVRDN